MKRPTLPSLFELLDADPQPDVLPPVPPPILAAAAIPEEVAPSEEREELVLDDEPLPEPAPEPDALPTEPAADFSLFGVDLFGDPIKPQLAKGKLSEQFTVPPFSVLDSRQGYWQERKRAWLSLGIQSELGRGAGTWVESAETGGPDDRQKSYNKAEPGGSARPAMKLGEDGKTRRGDGRGREMRQDGNLLGFSAAATIRRNGVGFDGGKVLRREGCNAYGTEGWQGTQYGQAATGTSIFDPVVCELTMRWFCPEAGIVLDPFAGGSVRGIIASRLGRRYLGIDLREEQIAANVHQADQICGVDDPRPEWCVGDSCQMERLLPHGFEGADLVFSCPPYADLERYSDNPADISTMSYTDFLVAYRQIVALSVAHLKMDRFACFVVGDVRGKDGLYRRLISDTEQAFHDAGARLYNEAILVTSVGSLPIRVQKQFNASRKLGKTHQQYLVFVKGDPRKASEACGGAFEAS